MQGTPAMGGSSAAGRIFPTRAMLMQLVFVCMNIAGSPSM